MSDNYHNWLNKNVLALLTIIFIQVSIRDLKYLKTVTLNLCGFKLMTYISQSPGTISDDGIKTGQKIGCLLFSLDLNYKPSCI